MKGESKSCSLLKVELRRVNVNLKLFYALNTIVNVNLKLKQPTHNYKTLKAI